MLTIATTVHVMTFRLSFLGISIDESCPSGPTAHHLRCGVPPNSFGQPDRQCQYLSPSLSCIYIISSMNRAQPQPQCSLLFSFVQHPRVRSRQEFSTNLALLPYTCYLLRHLVSKPSPSSGSPPVTLSLRRSTRSAMSKRYLSMNGSLSGLLI